LNEVRGLTDKVEELSKKLDQISGRRSKNLNTPSPFNKNSNEAAEFFSAKNVFPPDNTKYKSDEPSSGQSVDKFRGLLSRQSQTQKSSQS
jgi:hypothetical protein